MTPERALDRIRKLLALAAPASGAAEEERRTAALSAATMMHEHGLSPGLAPASGIDLDDVAALALRVVELEYLVTSERAAHATEIRARDEHWRQVVERIRRDERATARKATKGAARRGANQEREARARAGGQARAERLDPVRRTEIARTAARARWRRWRERHATRG